MGQSQTNDMQNPQGSQMQQLAQQLPPITNSQMQSPQGVQMSSIQGSPEELVEAIIDEKWNELVKDINKVIDWKQKADTKLATMEQQVSDMQQQFDKLHQAIIGKIGDYDKHMLDVSSELQAMDKTFSKILPTFVDNVNELSAITQKFRVEKKSSTKKSKVDDDE